MINLLWTVKAKLYQIIRTWFPFSLILQQENRNLELLLQSIDLTGEKVIDLGTGTGNVLRYLKKTDLLAGIDYNFTMLKIAKQSYPNAKLIQANVLNLPIKTGTIALITAAGLSEYLKDIEVLFNEAHRSLKNYGFFMCTFSPVGIWTQLRLLSGHRIFPRNLDEFEAIARNEKFRLTKNIATLMQGQILFQKLPTK